MTARLPAGGRVDRTRPLRFRFDGRALTGFAGDTLASALLANGIHLVGRSFKYHRPRGILSAGSEEPNALVEIDRGGGRREPNSRATMVPLTDGLVARSQNRWPSLRLDAASLAGFAAPLLPAGFYYKTFLGPGKEAWHKRWEPMIRRIAGLGRAPDAPDPDRYANRYAHCDVLVVGAGPSGLGAALDAAEAGARVILCDEQAEMGGTLLADPRQWERLAALLATLRGNPRVTLLPRSTAFHFGLQNFVSLAQLLDRPDGLRERLWQVRAGRVVIATGAIERPIPFAGNDRPGVMLADAARTYVARYGVLPGRRVVACVAHDSGYDAAFALQDAGADIAAILEMRDASSRLDTAAGRGITVLPAHGVAGTRGGLHVTGVRAAPRLRDGRVDAARARDIACDLVIMAGGWTPTLHLFSQARGRLRWDAAADAFLPGEAIPGIACAGACAGLAAGMPIRELGAAAPPQAFIDHQNDVTARDIALAVREGFTSIEHVKRYTTNGMATDQGKTSNMLGLAVAAATLGRDLPEVGLTTFRPPYTPVTFGTLAGRARGLDFEPVRKAPLHGWAEAQGAVFEPVGQWMRARYFPRPGEDMHAAVARECRTVREAVGMLDASTLGKIEVTGPDAAEFLERTYVTAVHSLKPGRSRYALLLREDGFVFDDGIIARLAPDRFHVTTTTGGAARVLHLLEDYRQTEFPDLRVWLTSTTEHWGVIAVQGPRARDLLAPNVEGLDIAREVFPHMACGAARICGVPGRLFRVSFTGELGFEVNIPAGHARAVWETLWRDGQRLGIAAYGTEAMHVLRAEKGYVIVGQETDGTVTPQDLGLGWAIGKAKRDFVGKRSLARPDMLRADRLQLVGLKPLDARMPEEGAQLIAGADGAGPAHGHVTSAYPDAVLGLLRAGRDRMGETVFATRLDGPPQPLQVVSPVFLDPKGERLHG